MASPSHRLIRHQSNPNPTRHRSHPGHIRRHLLHLLHLQIQQRPRNRRRNRLGAPSFAPLRRVGYRALHQAASSSQGMYSRSASPPRGVKARTRTTLPRTCRLNPSAYPIRRVLRGRPRLHLSTPKPHHHPNRRQRNHRYPNRPPQTHQSQAHQQNQSPQQHHPWPPLPSQHDPQRKPAGSRQQRSTPKLQRPHPPFIFRPEPRNPYRQFTTQKPQLPAICSRPDHVYLRKTTTVSK